MTKQEAIKQGRALATSFGNRGTAYLVIGHWQDAQLGEGYWCEAGYRTREAANEKAARVETTMSSHPRGATFEIVEA